MISMITTISQSRTLLFFHIIQFQVRVT